jgi:hypothetical protein
MESAAGHQSAGASKPGCSIKPSGSGRRLVSADAIFPFDAYGENCPPRSSDVCSWHEAAVPEVRLAVRYSGEAASIYSVRAFQLPTANQDLKTFQAALRTCRRLCGRLSPIGGLATWRMLGGGSPPRPYPIQALPRGVGLASAPDATYDFTAISGERLTGRPDRLSVDPGKRFTISMNRGRCPIDRPSWSQRSDRSMSRKVDTGFPQEMRPSIRTGPLPASREAGSGLEAKERVMEKDARPTPGPAKPGEPLPAKDAKAEDSGSNRGGRGRLPTRYELLREDWIEVDSL